ncbi:MAG: hypothetical protein JWO80_4126 [Bryobacterales bacterium]|nr:hypothetical protein [Bryobacterales bacterium]
MKNLTMKVFLSSAAAVVFAAVPSFAQTSGHVAVTVPFEFTAGSATLPAGDYDFVGEQNGVILISSVLQHKGVVVLTNPQSGAGVSYASPRVKFDKTNGQYTLTEIDLAGEPARKLIRFDHDGSSTSLGSKLGVTNAASKGLTK